MLDFRELLFVTSYLVQCLVFNSETNKKKKKSAEKIRWFTYFCILWVQIKCRNSRINQTAFNRSVNEYFSSQKCRFFSCYFFFPPSHSIWSFFEWNNYKVIFIINLLMNSISIILLIHYQFSWLFYIVLAV